MTTFTLNPNRPLSSGSNLIYNKPSVETGLSVVNSGIAGSGRGATGGGGGEGVRLTDSSTFTSFDTLHQQACNKTMSSFKHYTGEL